MKIKDLEIKKKEFREKYQGCDYYLIDDDDYLCAYIIRDLVDDYHLIKQLEPELDKGRIWLGDNRYINLRDADLFYNEKVEEFKDYFIDSESCKIIGAQEFDTFYKNKDYLIKITVGVVDGIISALWCAYELELVDTIMEEM